MEILQVITDTDRRGAQIQAVDLERALRGEDCLARTVALTPGTVGQTLKVPTLGRSRLAVTTLRALRKEMRTAAMTVGFGSSTLYACAAAGAGVKNPFVYRSIGDLRYWANTPMRRARMRLFLRRANAVVALWSGAAETLIEQLGVRPDHLRVIPNAVDASRYPSVTSERRLQLRTALGIRLQDPTLLYVGSLNEEKNVALVIDCMAELPEHQLLVLGGGTEQEALEERASRLGGWRPHFLGVRPAEEVLPAADVVVLPSRTEGLPGVLIEAGFCGLPSVATDVGGVADVVRNGESGVVVPADASPQQFADGVREALANAEAYGTAARRHCLSRFDSRVVVGEWLSLYRFMT